MELDNFKLSEIIVDEAIRKSLRVLTPRLRNIVLVLNFLGNSSQKIDNLKLLCKGIGFKCSGMEASLFYLEELGIIEREKDGSFVLSEYGNEIFMAFSGIIDNAKTIALKILEDVYSEDDILSFVSIPLASTIGVISSVEEEYLDAMLAVHAFISIFVSILLSLLTLYNSRLRESIVSLLVQA